MLLCCYSPGDICTASVILLDTFFPTGFNWSTVFFIILSVYDVMHNKHYYRECRKNEKEPHLPALVPFYPGNFAHTLDQRFSFLPLTFHIYKFYPEPLIFGLMISPRVGLKEIRATHTLRLSQKESVRPNYPCQRGEF